jgi:hypothetical protein
MRSTDDGVRDGKPKTCALSLAGRAHGPMEAIEDPVAVLVRYAGAGIVDGERGPAGILRNPHGHLSDAISSGA